MSLSLRGGEAGDVHDWNDSADDERELREIVLGKLVRRERLVGRAEVDGAGLNLRNAAAGADRLIVDRGSGLLLIIGCPGGQDRIDEGRTRARDLRARSRTAGIVACFPPWQAATSARAGSAEEILFMRAGLLLLCE